MPPKTDRPQPLVLVVLDGFGLGYAWHGNAMLEARLVNFKSYWYRFAHSVLQASGEAVGLPPRTQGNSETGHLNLGAGSIVRQDFGYISHFIATGEFFKNPVLLGALEHTKRYKSKLHILGLLSDGGVHSHYSHLFALLDLIVRERFDREVGLHLFLDGRDTPPTSALSYIKMVEDKIRQIPNVRIASLSGRYYAMDRDRRWQRTSRAWQAIALGVGLRSKNARDAVEKAYGTGFSDEFVPPTVIIPEAQTPFTVADNDAFIFFNFRPDRARQLTATFIKPNLTEMQISQTFNNLYFATFVLYDEFLPAKVVFQPEKPKITLAKVLSEQGLSQFHIAETEKYAHVTYFFNGGDEKPHPKEEWQLIPSPKVATYDLRPEMSAFVITKILKERLKQKKDDFILVNYANADMVGHTGNFSAIVIALQVLDTCLRTLTLAVWRAGGEVLVTADHGNAEEMISMRSGFPNTEHTANPVPIVYLSRENHRPFRPFGILADVAPTILEIMHIAQPPEMTGISLFRPLPAGVAFRSGESREREVARPS